VRSRQEPLYHLALAEDWDTARAGSTGYRTSTLGQDLADVGYIHCSYADQIQDVADRYYRDLDDVVLLTIDPERLTSRVVDEPDKGGEAEYPHIYGPVDLEAVVEVTPLDQRPDGTLELPVLTSGDGA